METKGCQHAALWAAEHRGDGGDGDVLRALEPTPDELAAAAPALASFYNDPYNRRMLANTVAMATEDVVASFHELRAAGARPFLLFAGERLMGDGDLRHLDARLATGEIAILVGDRARQGRGLGTRFAALLHAFAFRILGLERVYASIRPDNDPSLRLFARLGHARDTSATARTFADEAGDVTLSVARATFESTAGALLEGVHLTRRESPSRSA